MRSCGNIAAKENAKTVCSTMKKTENADWLAGNNRVSRKKRGTGEKQETEKRGESDHNRNRNRHTRSIQGKGRADAAVRRKKKEIKTEKRERDHKEGTGFSDLFHAAVDAIVEEQGW